MTSRWPRAVLHVDMDAFFVNVHRLAHPEDRGIPLVVGGRPDQRGVVASASYEARRFGIHSAMPTSQAVRLCPQLKIVGHDWPLIRASSRQVMDLLAAHGPLEQMSVDEAYVDLSEQPDPESLAVAIRAEVKAVTALPASVGLATSKLVAKVASDHEKPEGCTIVPPGTEAAFLAPLSTRAIWGIGPRTGERLEKLGVRTCGELATVDLGRLQAEFGRQAESLQRRAQGIDNRPVETDRGPAKSISQEWTFNEDLRQAAPLEAKLEQMAAAVAASLRKRDLLAHTVVVKFRWADFTTFTRQRSLDIAVDDPVAITRLALAIWRENWPEGRPVRLIGVGVSNLVEATGRQLGLGL